MTRPAQSLDDAHHVPALIRERHEVGDADATLRSVELRLQDQRARQISAPHTGYFGRWCQQPPPVLGATEQGGKARGGVKVRKHSQSIEPSQPTNAAV